MMKKQDREAKGEFWLRHLRDCAASGKRLADYAREHELDVAEGYRWTRVLRRAGHWPAQKRRNWLFADTVNGAKASASLYSLVQTARQ